MLQERQQEEEQQEEPTWEELILKLSKESDEKLKEYKDVLENEGLMTNFIVQVVDKPGGQTLLERMGLMLTEI